MLDQMDDQYKENCMIDEKTYQFICFALSIKARSKPCVLKHFKGALEAGATVKDGKQVKWKNLAKVWDYLDDREKFYAYVKSKIQNYLE